MAAVPSIGRASLVERSRVAPQAAATEGLYERHAAKLQSYCLHQLGSREEAEDAVQTTYMNAFRALGRGIVPEAESAWLFKIAENVCLSRRRSSWRRGRIESPSDFEIIEEIIPGPSRQNDELIGIEDALASMPEQQRRAILLREWQGLSYREIAEELEVTQSAVETLIFRARRSLAAGLEQPDSVKKPKRKASAALCMRSTSARSPRRSRRCSRGARPSRQQLLPSRSRRPPAPLTASNRRSSRSRRSGRRRRRRPWSASPRQPLRPRLRFPRPPDQLGSPRLPHRSVRPSPPRRSASEAKPAAAAVVKHSAPLHYIPAAVTPVQPPPAAQTPAAAEPASDQVSAPAAQPAEQPRADEGKNDSGKRNVEPVPQRDGPVVVATAAPATGSQTKAEPVADTSRGDDRTRPRCLQSSRTRLRRPPTADPAAPAPVATTPSTTKAQPVPGPGTN